MLWTDTLCSEVTILLDISARSSYCKGFSARGFCFCISFVKVIKVQILLQAALAAVVHRDRPQWCTGTGHSGARAPAAEMQGTGLSGARTTGDGVSKQPLWRPG